MWEIFYLRHHVSVQVLDLGEVWIFRLGMFNPYFKMGRVTEQIAMKILFTNTVKMK
jgi:hypothetical protein